MNFSTAGISLLQKLEGLSLKPYRDAGGLWTIGYGHLIKPGEDYLMNGISEDDAHKLFVSDIVPFIQRVNTHVSRPLTQPQFDALVIWDYNTGKIHNSTLTNLVNAGGDTTTIYNWWTNHYLTASGKPSEGLIKRRVTEATLFTGGKPATSSMTLLPVMAIGLIGLGFYFSRKR